MDIRSAITPIFSSLAFAGRYSINELVEQLSWCIKPIHGHEINLRFEEDEKREVFGVTIYCLDESGMDVYSESVFREIAFIDAIIKWNTLLRNKCLTR